MIRRAAMLLLSAAPLHGDVNPRLEYALGVLEESRGNEDEAGRHYENARLADPTAAPLVRIAVQRALSEGNRAEAIRLYRELSSAHAGDAGIQIDYADFLIELDRDDALARQLASKALHDALSTHPGDPEIIRRLFTLDDEDRGGLLEKLAPDDPEAVLLYVTLHRSLHEADDEAARKRIDQRFLRAMEAHPEHAALARQASEHFRNTRRLDEAITILQRHLEAAPWSLDLRTRLGILCFTAGRHADGEAMLKELLGIHPRQALAHQALAKHYRGRGNTERAAYHAGELLKIRGGSPSEFLRLADEHLAADRPKDARLLLEKAVFDHPEDAELRMKLAIASHRDPETRALAARLFREAETAIPDGKISDPVFLTASAEVMIASGQSKAGEERLRAAIRAYPADAKKDTAAALRRLASLWQSENRNTDAAKALMQRADALDPK